MRTRRDFLLAGATVAAGLALTPAGAAGWSCMARRDPGIGEISQASFAAQVNTDFRVRLASGRVVRLTLLRAPLARSVPAAGGRPTRAEAGNEKFSLIFSGPAAVVLASAIHRFEHEVLGRFELHLGEVGVRPADAVRYEAVINRPAPGAAAS
jgi:hypothetical protein